MVNSEIGNTFYYFCNSWLHSYLPSILKIVVSDLIFSNDTVEGVLTQGKIKFITKTIVLTAGTFLNGRIYVGKDSYSAGRSGDSASISLAKKMKNYGFQCGRLKTGTPPRIDGKTIDFKKVWGQQVQTIAVTKINNDL